MNLKYFSIDEFDCSHTGENKMNPAFLDRLDDLRERCGFPFVITSGYRSDTHPVEAEKTSPGMHSYGIAADIAVKDGIQRRKIVQEAMNRGFTAIGVAQGFVHVDDRIGSPVMWGYDD